MPSGSSTMRPPASLSRTSTSTSGCSATAPKTAPSLVTVWISVVMRRFSTFVSFTAETVTVLFVIQSASVNVTVTGVDTCVVSRATVTVTVSPGSGERVSETVYVSDAPPSTTCVVVPVCVTMRPALSLSMTFTSTFAIGRRSNAGFVLSIEWLTTATRSPSEAVSDAART